MRRKRAVSYHKESSADKPSIDHWQPSLPDLENSDSEFERVRASEAAFHLAYSRWPLPRWAVPRRRKNIIRRAVSAVVRSPLRGLCYPISGALGAIVFLVVFTAIFRPSYTHPPPRYAELARRCASSSIEMMAGCANPREEKIFIAASVFDRRGDLAGGAWGKAVQELIHVLGPRNVFFSLYENDPDDEAMMALDILSSRVSSNKSIVVEHLPLANLSYTTIPSGESIIDRIQYLAEVRNKALRLLDGPDSDLPLARQLTSTIFDKVLFMNDVVFNPIEAAQLLFLTGANEAGQTNYRGVCAADFINPFKYYDTFATRDLNGNTLGIPFYPWFTSARGGATRRDVLEQRDAVRVRSCWGGMAAYEAAWFQATEKQVTISRDVEEAAERMPAYATTARRRDRRLPAIRFRSSTDQYWSSSECCLINADVQYVRNHIGSDTQADSGIYMNPYVRVAYDAKTLGWLSWTRRTERLYSFIHDILNAVMRMPSHNARLLDEPGEWVEETVYTNSSFREVGRVAEPGMFCGAWSLMKINEGAGFLDGPRWSAVKVPKPEPRGRDMTKDG